MTPIWGRICNYSSDSTTYLPTLVRNRIIQSVIIEARRGLCGQCIDVLEHVREQLFLCPSVASRQNKFKRCQWVYRWSHSRLSIGGKARFSSLLNRRHPPLSVPESIQYFQNKQLRQMAICVGRYSLQRRMAVLDRIGRTHIFVLINVFEGWVTRNEAGEENWVFASPLRAFVKVWENIISRSDIVRVMEHVL